MSLWCQADAVNDISGFKLNQEIQNIIYTSKLHNFYSVTPNWTNNIWKMIRKIQSIHLYHFHAWSNKLSWCFNQNKKRHFKRPYLNLEFESLIQICSNTSGFSCISPTHSYCHVSCMHHIVAHYLVMPVYRYPLRQALSPRSTVITLTKSRIRATNHQASNQPFDHIDTIPCSRSCSLLLH